MKLHVGKQKKFNNKKHSKVGMTQSRKYTRVGKTNKPVLLPVEEDQQSLAQTHITQAIDKQTEQQHAIETIIKQMNSEQQVNTEPDIQTIDRGGEDDPIITQQILTEAEHHEAVETILEELNSEEQLNNEPDIQMIGRGDFHDGITIINIDDIIQSRVKSLNVPDMSAEQDPRTTSLSDT